MRCRITRTSNGSTLVLRLLWRARWSPSQGKGQKWELVAREYRNCRRRRRKLSAPEKRAHAGIFARDRASASALESFRLRVSRAQPARVRRSPVFSGSRFRLRPYAHHHRKRLRRRRRVVSRFNDRHQESAAENTARSITRRIFSPAKLISPSVGSSKRKRSPARLARFTPSARHFAPRIQTRRDTPASSG